MGTWDITLIMVLNKANLDCLTIYSCQLLCSYDLKFDKAVILWGEILLYSVLQKRLLIAFLSCLAWVKEEGFISRMSMIVRVNAVLRTVVVDSDCRFDNLRGNNLHSQDSEDDYRTGCRILNLLMKLLLGSKLSQREYWNVAVTFETVPMVSCFTQKNVIFPSLFQPWAPVIKRRQWFQKPPRILPIMARTGRLRPKWVPFSGFRYMKL